jgi:hypothetical protein
MSQPPHAADGGDSPRHALRMMVMLLPLAVVAIVVSGLDRMEARRPVMLIPLEERIDINTADPASLILLPRVGPTIAGRIVEHREAIGGFDSVEQLQQVPHIGPQTIQRLDQWTDFGEVLLD